MTHQVGYGLGTYAWYAVERAAYEGFGTLVAVERDTKTMGLVTNVHHHFEGLARAFLYVIGRSIVQIGNQDPVGKFSASNIVDGKIRLAIGNELEVAIHAKDHKLFFNANPNRDGVMSEMRFADLATARDLFDGKLNAVAAVGLGKVRIGGMISQIDNVNRILDRVSLYLA